MRTILETTTRHPMSAGAIKQLRREGFVPASVSARGAETQHYTVSRQKLTTILQQYGNSALIELEGPAGEGKVLVIARDIQRDPISNRLLHVGFQRLSTREPITADVRLTLLGEPPDAHNGVGTLTQMAFTVQVRAEPDKLPSHIEVDTSEMKIGSVLTLSALSLDGAYEIVTPPETVVAVLQTVRGAVSREDEENATKDETPEEKLPN